MHNNPVQRGLVKQPVSQFGPQKNICQRKFNKISESLTRLHKWMMDALSIEPMTEEQNDRISAAIAREQSRLRNFIRKQVVDESDAEDILQEVFYELVQAYRLMKPLEQVGAWLFRVAQNRITDLFFERRGFSHAPSGQ